MLIEVGRLHPIGTGTTRALGIEREVGRREAARASDAGVRYLGDHLGLPVACRMDLRPRFAHPAGLIHDQGRWQGLLRSEVVPQHRDGRILIWGTAGRHHGSPDPRGAGGKHRITPQHRRVGLMLAEGCFKVHRAHDPVLHVGRDGERVQIIKGRPL